MPAEKIEIIKQIIETDSEQVLKKIKSILYDAKKIRKTGNNLSPAMTKRLEESKEQIKKRKGIKVPLSEIWK
jgi:hypothetical protein